MYFSLGRMPNFSSFRYKLLLHENDVNSLKSLKSRELNLQPSALNELSFGKFFKFIVSKNALSLQPIFLTLENYLESVPLN
jgi:hypothetical protein